MSSDKNRVDYVCQLYQRMLPHWVVVEDVLAGTHRLRTECGVYLPQFPAEPDPSYRRRVTTATLFTAYADTLDGVIGIVFGRDPVLGKDVPAEIQNELENVDLCGTAWTVFTREVFRSAVHLGHSAVLVDMQQPLTPGVSKYEAQQTSRRPYWVHYTADQIINWRSDVIDGQTVLTLIVFRESTRESDGPYGEKLVTRYREWRLDGAGNVTWAVYREPEGQDTRGTGDTGTANAPILESSGIVPEQDRIPVAIFYGSAEPQYGPIASCPPLQDLAYLNIKHFQQQSDYDAGLHICGTPLLFATGRSPQQQKQPFQAVGLTSLIDLPEGSQLGYAEPSGAALGSARQNLQDLQEQMKQMGLRLVLESGVPRTATEQMLKAHAYSSVLAEMAAQCHDGIETALGFHAKYKGLESGGSVTMGSAVEELVISAQDLQVYAQMQVNGQLSLDTLWAMMEKANVLPDDFDPKQEEKEIADEKAVAAEEAQASLPPALQQQQQAPGAEGAQPQPKAGL